MEEIRENVNPVENVVPDEIVPGFVAAEDKEKDEKREPEIQEAVGTMPEAKSEEQGRPANGGKATDSNSTHYIIEAFLGLAVIVLFILHFMGGGKKDNPVAAPVQQAGDGSIVYVNMDSINDKYEMVSLLTDSLDQEKQRQSVHFQNRQKTLENKLANYQRQMQNNQLTPQQAQYAEASLQQESQQLQNDYAQALEALEARYAAALEQIADSLRTVCARVNAQRNASFVFTYGASSPIVVADPSCDITNAVLDELNKPFTKKKKK